MKLSILVPTCGRPTLQRALASLAAQPLDPTDEVLVIGGDAGVIASFAAGGYELRHIPSALGHDWGNMERTLGISVARGTHLAFMDDDDWWLPGARAAIADAMQRTPTHPVLFRMQYLDGRLLWDKKLVACGNVSTIQILIPNDPLRLGRWTKRREGDYDFLASMKWPASDVVWREDVIAQVGKNR
jgi:glycosyltransferase involved in cell wall biosynthesis